MTVGAPASTSIGAATQPVCAPQSASWQSCAPIGSPGATRAAASISVNGTHTATSTPSCAAAAAHDRSEEQTSELQSLMRISYAVFCLHKKNTHRKHSAPQD